MLGRTHAQRFIFLYGETLAPSARRLLRQIDEGTLGGDERLQSWVDSNP